MTAAGASDPGGMGPKRIWLVAVLFGLVSALVYGTIITVRCWRNPDLGPRITGYTWPQRFKSLPGTFPIVLVIAIIFYSMLFGWATPSVSQNAWMEMRGTGRSACRADISGVAVSVSAGLS